MVNSEEIDIKQVWQVLATVSDPEIPVLPITDLGIVKAVFLQDGILHVQITPTYSGCPAGDVILFDVQAALMAAGFEKAVVENVIFPAWTTDDITPVGKQLLENYGIAPPVNRYLSNIDLEKITVPCPRCKSENTSLVSAFGSTACKALFKCNDCLEPFDYFKCH